MKKLPLILAVVAALLVACNGNNKDLQHDSIVDLTAQYNEASSFNDSLMLLMGDIYAGLDSINMQEGLLNNLGRSGDNGNRREEIRLNLENIKARLKANRQILSEMESKLKDTKNQNSVLAKTIEQLKTRLEQQDARIAQLEGDLKTANTKIEDLQNTVTEKEAQVAEETAAKEKAQQETVAAEAAANRVYYAIGTNKELKQKGLLEKKFLGSTKVLQGDFDANYFTVADKRNLTEIPTGSKKVKIWSTMPQNSYYIDDAPNGTKVIRIQDPARFWSISSHLIIQVD